MTTAFPLSWPDHIPRHSHAREPGKFKTALHNALKNVQDALRCFASDSGKKLENVVISSNCTLGVNRPPDPGVAVWFTWDGLQVCIPVDRYSTVEANLQAIYHVMEARRTEMRHGTLALVRASFRGFQALPPPTSANAPHWTETLGVARDATVEQIEAAYRGKAKGAHPDMPGGSHEAMARLNTAKQQAMKEAAR